MIPNTPYVGVGGVSVRTPIVGGGMSPAFTPMRIGGLEFTPTYDFEGFQNQRSPMPTPLSYPQTPMQQTPTINMGSPIGGSSYYNPNRTSNMRSPHYLNQSSSPNYSSIRQMSQSPDYGNSPVNSPYSSSPNYGSIANDSGREGNYKEEESDREDEDDY